MGFKPVNRVLSVVDRLSELVSRIAMILVLGLVFAMFYEVVARYAFNAPTRWSYDISYMFNAGIFLLGAAYTQSINQHIRIDFLSQRMRPRVQHFVNLAVLSCLFLPAMSWITFRATRSAWKAFVTGKVEVVSPWAPVIWPFESAIALGLICLCLQTVAQIVRHGYGIYDPHAVPPPSDKPDDKPEEMPAT